MNQDMTSYYRERALEYDKVYWRPEEQEDLLRAADLFQSIFAHKAVLEIACGTGYWTAQIAKTAASVLATDINKAVIDIAQAKHFSGQVTFEVADMNRLTTYKKFDGVFGGFIWSHVLLQDIDNFLSHLAARVVENGDIAFIDSLQVEGSNHDKKRITRVDPHGNTFQIRQLENGTTHEVLKNYPSHDFLREKLSRVATDINWIQLEHYWIATGKRRAELE